MTLFTENFVGSNGDLVSARTGWSASPTGTQVTKIDASNQCQWTASQDAGCALHDTGAADHYAQCTVGTAVTPGLQLQNTIIVVRCTNDRTSGYGWSFDNTGTHRIIRNDTLGIVFSAVNLLSAADVMKITAVGTTITLSRNGSTILTGTNSVFTAGTRTAIGIGNTSSTAADPIMTQFVSDTIVGSGGGFGPLIAGYRNSLIGGGLILS